MNDYLIYIGKEIGTLPGVPARNLSFEEAEQHGIEKLLQSKLYVYGEEVKEAKPAKKKAKRRVKDG